MFIVDTVRESRDSYWGQKLFPYFRPIPFLFLPSDGDNNWGDRGKTGWIFFNIDILLICNEISKCKNLFEYNK